MNRVGWMMAVVAEESSKTEVNVNVLARQLTPKDQASAGEKMVVAENADLL